jgi:hypothetical protein
MNINTFNTTLQNQANTISDIKYNLGMSGNGIISLSEEGLYDIRDYSQIQAEGSFSFNSMLKDTAVATKNIEKGEFVYISPFTYNIGNLTDTLTDRYSSVAFTENVIMTLFYRESTNGDSSYGNLYGNISIYENEELLSSTDTLLVENVILNYSLFSIALSETTACVLCQRSSQNISVLLINRAGSSLTVNSTATIVGEYLRNCVLLEQNKVFYACRNFFYGNMKCGILNFSNGTIQQYTYDLTAQLSDEYSIEVCSVKMSSTKVIVVARINSKLRIFTCLINGTNVTITSEETTNYSGNIMSGAKVNDNTIVLPFMYAIGGAVLDPHRYYLILIKFTSSGAIESITNTQLMSNLPIQSRIPCAIFNNEIYSVSIQDHDVFLTKILIDGEAVSFSNTPIFKISDFQINESIIPSLIEAPNGLLATFGDGINIYTAYFKNKNMVTNELNYFNGIALSSGTPGDTIRVGLVGQEE